MNILSVDTTHGDCSVALLQGGIIAANITDAESGKQAERMLSIIEDVLESGSCSYDDLSAIAVNIGPGSFTGVRIGMAGVKGLNLVKKIPLIEVTSFESVAHKAKEHSKNKNILAVLDAKRGQVYAQMLNQDMKSLSSPQLLNYKDIVECIIEPDFLLTGNGSGLIIDFLIESGYNFSTVNPNAASDAVSIAHVAGRKFSEGMYSNSISPLYLRKPDAKISQKP